MDAKIATLYVTCPSQEEARRIASKLVGDRLAACANILPGVSSIFHWQGGIEEDREVAVLFKLPAAKIEAASAAIAALHSYDTPCVVAWPIIGGSDQYAEWVLRETEKT